MEEEKLVRIEDITEVDAARIAEMSFVHGVRGSVFDRRKQFYEFMRETLYSEQGLFPYGICVRPEDVRHAKECLNANGKHPIKLISVVGFPDGCWYSSQIKCNEALQAIKDGAQEIDFVMNYEKFKGGDLDYVVREVKSIQEIAERTRTLTKMILEATELDDEQIVKACQIATAAGVDFVGDVTGYFGIAGLNKLKLMRENFPRGIKLDGREDEEKNDDFLRLLSGRSDGYIDLNPRLLRVWSNNPY